MDNSYIWVNIIFATIILTIYLTILQRIKKQKMHIYIYTFVWGGLILGNQIIGVPYLISIETLIIVYLAWITFLLGSIAVYLYYANEKNETDRGVEYSAIRLKTALYVLILLSIIANYLYFKNASSTIQGLESLALLRTRAVRDVLSESNIFFNLFGRAYNIYIPIAFMLYSKKRLSLSILTVILLLALVVGASSFTRAPILNILICIIVSAILSGQKIRLNIFTSSFIAGFVGLMYYLTNEINTKLSSVKVNDADELVLKSIIYYIFGGIKGFQEIVEGNYIDQSKKYYDIPIYTLDFFNYFLKRLGLIDNYPSLLREYTFIGDMETNVYTYLDCFMLDFGVTGVLLGSAFLGLMITYIAVQTQFRKTITLTVIYCFCCFGIAIIFMNNEFIRNTVFLMMIPLTLMEFIARFNMNPNNSYNDIDTL